MESILISYLEVLQKFTKFDGRAGRREFWTFSISNIAAYGILGILGAIPFLGAIFRIVSVIFSIAILVPSLAVGSRRLHDTGRSAMLLFLGLIPFAGIIILLALCIPEGIPGDNQYGTDPKAIL